MTRNLQTNGGLLNGKPNPTSLFTSLDKCTLDTDCPDKLGCCMYVAGADIPAKSASNLRRLGHANIGWQVLQHWLNENECRVFTNCAP